jgi:hypothetical protein
MNVRIFAVLALSFVAFSLLRPEQRVGAQDQQIDPERDFQERLVRMSKLPPDACMASAEEEKTWNPADSEYRLFSRGAEVVEQALNAADASSESAKARASEALEKLEKMSGEVNAAWPEENRFHFEVLDIPPALAVKMRIRTSATYFVFAAPAEDASGNPNLRWQRVGSDDAPFEQESARSLIELFALRRGPSGNGRFLARIEPFGCAGSIGVVYDAREWNPEGLGRLDQIIKQTGSLGLDDQVPGFEWIGDLKTDGDLITLPYCGFSSIDTWDNPSLCAVDTYDLSGEGVQFVSRDYNRPDLVPIAKAIEFAQQHDYAALLGYCASSEVARDMVRELGPHFYAEDVRVTPTGNRRERVELGDDGTFQFDVEQRGDRWVVVAFHME